MKPADFNCKWWWWPANIGGINLLIDIYFISLVIVHPFPRIPVTSGRRLINTHNRIPSRDGKKLWAVLTNICRSDKRIVSKVEAISICSSGEGISSKLSPSSMLLVYNKIWTATAHVMKYFIWLKSFHEKLVIFKKLAFEKARFLRRFFSVKCACKSFFPLCRFIKSFFQPRSRTLINKRFWRFVN